MILSKYKKWKGDDHPIYINDDLRTGWQWKRLGGALFYLGKHKRVVIEEEVYRYGDDWEVRIWEGNAEYFMSIKKDFNEELGICEKIIEEAFPKPQVTNNKYIGIIDDMQSIFFNAYTAIFKFISSYPQEDSYSAAIVGKAKGNLEHYFKLLQECTKELSKLLLKDEEVDLSYIEESISQIQGYKNNGE